MSNLDLEESGEDVVSFLLEEVPPIRCLYSATSTCWISVIVQ